MMRKGGGHSERKSGLAVGLAQSDHSVGLDPQPVGLAPTSPMETGGGHGERKSGLAVGLARPDHRMGLVASPVSAPGIPGAVPGSPSDALRPQ